MSSAPLNYVTRLFYKPRWLKHALLLDKAAKRFVNYKRDLLPADRITEVNARRADLKNAIRANNPEAAKEAGKRLEVACEESLPSGKRPDAIAENIEVFFVAIVIALGIRTYFLQPFRIPTGSMQPSLNGIRGEIVSKDDWPAFPVRWLQIPFKGRTYFHEVADKDLELASPYLDESITEKTYLNFFTFTKIRFSDGSSVSVSAPRDLILNDFGLAAKFGARGVNEGGRPRLKASQTKIPKGAIILSGYSQSGDLVLVDKVSYHFRRPDRGETSVFDTRGNRGVMAASGPQGAGSHYIKRLAGVPGDTLSIGGETGQDGNLYIDGKVATEKGLVRVMKQEEEYAENNGYELATRGIPGYGPAKLGKPSDKLTLLDEKAAPLMREYAALGDNTDNSLDSRYWGTVKEYNLVGPALFSLWPITTGHWGFIE